MRLATFNIENLFERPRAMNLATWESGQPAIDAAAQLNTLFNQPIWYPDRCPVRPSKPVVAAGNTRILLGE